MPSRPPSAAGEPAGEVVGAAHEHPVSPGHEALPLLAVLAHLPRPAHPAVPHAVRGGARGLREPHAQVRVPVARDAAV